MTGREFEQALRALLREHVARSGNQRCVECQGSERCTDSTFCQRSRELVRCHYCLECERSVDCTHCRLSAELVACSHCSACRHCAQSAYLEHCLDCDDCRYCFGCVGLTGREFFILNQPYDRGAYFALTAPLARALPHSLLPAS